MEDEIYMISSQILEKVFAKTDSLRNQVFASRTSKKKQLLKLCCDVIHYRKILQSIVDRVPELTKENAFHHSEAYLFVVLYEFLFGKQALKCERKVRNALEKRRANILGAKAELTSQGLLDADGKLIENLTKEVPWSDLPIPRYARVNTLLTDEETILKRLKREGWQLVHSETTNVNRTQYRTMISSLGESEFMLDKDIPGLLIFPQGTDLHSTNQVVNRELILQDKASALPVICLNPTPGATVIDACAAPGIKTTHMAGLMKNKGTIYAFDRNSARYKTLDQLLRDSGVECAEAVLQDHLKTDLYSAELGAATFALVDPPCSGSGIVSRLKTNEEYESKPEPRLRSLSNIQAMLLKHTLRLPNLKRVVYSTCSIYEEENEMVIQEVVDSEEFSSQYDIVNAFPQWKHRGKKGYAFGRLCLRSSPEKELSNGFFVAVFERKN